MAEPLPGALARVRALLLDDAVLVKAVAAGTRRGSTSGWRRVELRYVDLKAGRQLQVTRYDATQAFTSNHSGDDAAAVVDVLLAEPFGNWHVTTAAEELQLRVTKRVEAMVHHAQRPGRTAPAGQECAEVTSLDRGHDRRKPRLLPEDDPVLVQLGISDSQGRVKPSRQAKYRQVEELLRALGPAVDDAMAAGALRTPTDASPWTVVDLGCGNAYLTFAAHRYFSQVRRFPVRVVGVDVKEQSREHNTAVARRLGVEDQAVFVRGSITDADLPSGVPDPDIVLALHACDTATDDALARAVRWQAPLVLAAPCCHHDVSAQLRAAEQPASSLLLRDGILRERFADTLTDALRAGVLRLRGYRVDVVEFVESRHTPRNTLLRAVRTGAPPTESARADLEALTSTWQVRSRLCELLG